MKNILMIAETDIGTMESPGVVKKLLGQYKAFRNLGYDVYGLFRENNAGVLLHEGKKEIVVNPQIKGYLSYVKMFGLAKQICQDKKIELCYIRYPLADWVFTKMVRNLHCICKVVVEIPTYPYDKDLETAGSFTAKLNFRQDLKNRKKLYNYIDYFVSYGYEENIYRIKTISISNGIDIHGIQARAQPEQDKTVLIGVALLSYVHGYDRVIEGINRYYDQGGKQNIIFYIVGEGDERVNLESLVRRYQLENHVIFTGMKKGLELDELYAKTDIAVASLGLHRRGSNISSELKAREYCARGIPFIRSGVDASIPDSVPFVLQLPADDTPVDFEKLIEFDERCCTDSVSMMERQFAEEKLSWDVQLKKVIETIEK